MTIQAPIEPKHPALLRKEAERAESVQNQIADSITTFAGSMMFVYIHLLWFAVWIIFRVEKYPFGLLTMIVSLEAIFLSTFILITQNRQEARSELRAEFDFRNNVRGEIWAAHIGQALGLDADHVEDIVRRTVESYVMEAEAQAG